MPRISRYSPQHRERDNHREEQTECARTAHGDPPSGDISIDSLVAQLLESTFGWWRLASQDRGAGESPQQASPRICPQMHSSASAGAGLKLKGGGGLMGVNKPQSHPEPSERP